MAAPNLTIAVEPSEASSVVYGQLAAKSSEDAPEGQLSLALAITNNEATDVHLNEVTVSFEPSVTVSPSTIAADLTIASTETAFWWFNKTDNIILPVPAPTALKLSLACDNFSAPAVANFSLAPYASPASNGGYLFPAKPDDLEKTEFWFGVSAQHDPGGLGTPGTFAAGTQLFAYDMRVWGFDDASQQWTASTDRDDWEQESGCPNLGKADLCDGWWVRRSVQERYAGQYHLRSTNPNADASGGKPLLYPARPRPCAVCTFPDGLVEFCSSVERRCL